MKIYSLHFKWTISLGRETYGYNICTLLVDGEKVASCNGGGYDMQGTVFGEWLQNSFEGKLFQFMREKGAFEIPACRSYNGGKKGTIYIHELPDYYGMSLYVPEKSTSKVALDGACGFSSMQRIAEAIGIKLKWNKESDKYKNHSFYTAIAD